MAQVATAIAGYNSFLFETDHVVGRMEGSGGKVALQFQHAGRACRHAQSSLLEEKHAHLRTSHAAAAGARNPGRGDQRC